MNYLAILTRPMGERYGAERPIVVPDGKGFQDYRLTMPDGSTPRVRVLDPEEKNTVQVRLLVPVTKNGQPKPESREITVTRAYWNANAKSTFFEGLLPGVDLLVDAALSGGVGAALGSFLPSYGATRGAGVGLAFMAGRKAGKAFMTEDDPRANTVQMRVGALTGGVAAAAGTALWVKRR